MAIPYTVSSTHMFTVASVDVEQVFSFSGKTINPLRMCLSDQSMRAPIMLNPWMTIPALDVEQTFKEKLTQGWKHGAKWEEHEEAMQVDMDT